MKETILRDYFDNKIPVDALATDLKDSQKQTSYDIVSVQVDYINEPGEYEITRNHLIRICDDTIAGSLTTTDLNTIAFGLVFSDYFTWDNGSEDGRIVGDTIHDWDGPEIGFPLTIDNVRRWKKYLETGEYTFDKRELKRNELKRPR